MLTLPRRLTYDDYRRIPDDGQRYEIIDGEVYVSPSPALECFVLAGDSYGLVASGQRALTVAVPGFESLTLSLTPLWIDLPAT